MKKVFLTAFLALLFMATSNLHAASGTYIDCMHSCPDMNVCNETFSSILSTCNAKRNQCENLCHPQDKDCRDRCMRDRNACLGQGSRDFDCPHRKAGDQQQVMTKRVMPKRSECKECHEDDR